MEDLITLITNTLEIPYVAEGRAVMDGSFSVEPWMTSALRANGNPVHMTDSMTVYLYYENKADAINATKAIWPVLTQSHYAVSTPGYTYQKDGELWMASFNVDK